MTETADPTKTNNAPAEDSPTGTVTGADAMAAGTNKDGATKGYLGEDAADRLSAARESDDTPDPGVLHELVAPTTFEGAQPPAGHVADPTSRGHVGSTGDLSKGKTSDPRPKSAKGTRGTSADNASKAAKGTQTGSATPAGAAGTQQAGTTQEGAKGARGDADNS